MCKVWATLGVPIYCICRNFGAWQSILAGVYPNIRMSFHSLLSLSVTPNTANFAANRSLLKHSPKNKFYKHLLDQIRHQRAYRENCPSDNQVESILERYMHSFWCWTRGSLELLNFDRYPIS